MDDDIMERAEACAEALSRCVIGRLGFGIHGIVFALQGNPDPGITALKVCGARGPYRREREIYQRLKEEAVSEIRGFRVPQLLGFDDDRWALEMTVVKPPFVLDFAGAYLDFPPQFSDEVWAEWEAKNREQFGEDWTMAQIILADLEDLGIYMHDPSPSNIRFR